MATCTWIATGANKTWQTAANWDTNSIPGSGDDVIFNGVIGTARCYHEFGTGGNIEPTVKSLVITSGFTGGFGSKLTPFSITNNNQWNLSVINNVSLAGTAANVILMTGVGTLACSSTSFRLTVAGGTRTFAGNVTSGGAQTNNGATLNLAGFNWTIGGGGNLSFLAGSTISDLGGSTITANIITSAVSAGGTSAWFLTVSSANLNSGTYTNCHASIPINASAGTAVDGGGNVNITFPTPTPTVSSVAASSGSTLGGTAVTITGTGFSSVTSVTFGGVAATSVVTVNATTVTCVTPAHSAGAVNVVVTNTGGHTGTGTGVFTYVVTNPVVSSAAPNHGPTAGGTPITITGSNFNAVASVTIGGVAATSVVTVNSTTVTCVAPAHAAGLVNIVVTNGNTLAGTGTGKFTFIAPPVITSVAPSSSLPDGDDPIVVTGTNFDAGAVLTIDGVEPAAYTVDSSTQISFVSDAHAEGVVALVVTNDDGQSDTADFEFADIIPEACQLNTITLKNNSAYPALFVDGALVQPGATHVINFVGLSCARQDKLRTACQNVATGNVFSIHDIDAGE